MWLLEIYLAFSCHFQFHIELSVVDISGYENVSIHMKDLSVENEDFTFHTRNERCERM